MFFNRDGVKNLLCAVGKDIPRFNRIPRYARNDTELKRERFHVKETFHNMKQGNY